MTPAQIKSHFTNWRAWELNPIVVKELRQAVRSWAVTGMLLLFLAVLFCTALGFLVSQSFQSNINQMLGAVVFQSFVAILTIASLTFIPIYVGIRLAAERQESNVDLLYISTLSPGRIIRGKFFCGAYMTVLFFSACMPFMAFTNLLRGIDLPTIFLILVFLFFVVCGAIQVAIFVACLPVSKVLKILLALFGTVGVFMFMGPLVVFSFGMMGSGLGAMMVSGHGFWTGFVASAGTGLAAVLLLYFMSVALISPVSANRALPLRSYITLVWALGALVSFYWLWKKHDAQVLLPWAIMTFIMITGAMAVVVSNQDQLSLRVRAGIPAHPLKRAFAFLFFNGAAGGLVWLALLSGTTFFISSWFLRRVGFSSMTPPDLKDFTVSAGAFLLYVFAYALTGLFVHRRFFSRRPPKLAGVFAVLIPAAWAFVPNMLLFFLNRLSWASVERLQAGNVTNLFIVKNERAKTAHLVCAAAWVLLMLVLNANWFTRQIKCFQPLDRRPPPQISGTVASLPPDPEG